MALSILARLRLHLSAWLFRNVLWLVTLPRTLPRDRYRLETKVDTGETGKCRVCIYLPKKVSSSKAKGVLLHMHAGGWVIFQPEIEKALCRYLCDTLEMVVVSPDYCKAPRYPYPVALKQCYAVLTWIAGGGLESFLKTRKREPPNGIDSQRLFLSGCSAGGNLSAAISTMIHSKDFPRPLPNNAKVLSQTLIYPVLNFSESHESKEARMPKQPPPDFPGLLPGWMSRLFLGAYVPYHAISPDSVKDPLVSPLLASKDVIKDMPKTIIITAEMDYLSCDGRDYAKKLKENGVTVVQREFEGVGHVFDNILFMPGKYREHFERARKEAWSLVANEMVPQVE